MKEVTINMVYKVTDECYDKNLSELVEEVKTGRFQRDLKRDNEGLKGITVTVHVKTINKELLK